MASIHSRSVGRQGQTFLKIAVPCLGVLLAAAFAALGCKSSPDVNQDIGAPGKSEVRAVPTEQIKINQGMKIALIQNFPLMNGTQIKMLSGIKRLIEIQTPLSSEGLTFKWELKWEGTPSVAAAGTESQPTAEIPSSESYREEGTMTLADLVKARSMALPAFWPPGELYLSNSSAIWLSDRGFQDLKKNKVSEWNLGLLGSSLWGAVPSASLFEALIQKFQQELEKQPEKLMALQEIKVLDQSDAYTVKINGHDQEVDTLIAGNWLAEYRILNNTLNPLILEVRLMPDADGGETLFSALAPIKALLEYRVESIDLPSGKIGQSF